MKEENRKNIFKSVEIIGIFSALLSFIVFESQVFKSIQSGLVLVGLSLTMLGALTFFVLTLDLVCDGLSKLKRLRISLLSLSVIFVFVGYLAANNGYKNSDFTVYVKNDEIDQRIKDQINSVNFNSAIQYDIKFMEFKNCILKRGLAQCL